MCIKKYISIIILVGCIVSCNSHSVHWETIIGVETYIEENPDSALTILENIDMQALQGKEEEAKYALLYSMALDKNYIDKTDFKVLQPAIDYYIDNGNATDKLRTYYYQGRIYHNQGMEARAMECYVNAIENGEFSDDILTKARTYVAQSIIYNSLYEWDNYIVSNKNAARCYKKANYEENYINCLIRIINGYTLKRDKQNILPYIEECKSMSHSISPEILSAFYSSYLVYEIRYGVEQEIKDIINEYVNIVPGSLVDWVTVSCAYCEIGMYNDALKCLSLHERNNGIINKQKFLVVTAEIHKNLGNYKKALEVYEKFQELQDSTDFAIYTQDTKFVKERHELELQALKEQEAKNKVQLWATVFIVLLLAVIVWVRARLKVNGMRRAVAEQELEKYRIMYEQIQEERDNLTDLLAQNEELEPYVKSAVVMRLELLNKFFTAYITNNSEIDKKANMEMEELLANKDSFMTSTRLAFAGSHPKFIKYLEEHGLSKWEIGYCCLYALGLKGKEVGSYIRMRSHYNISSEVREKLGINEHDTNLGIYIRKLLKSSE